MLHFRYARNRREIVAQVRPLVFDRSAATFDFLIRMPLRTIADEELLVRIRSHDEDALRELLVKYYVRLGEFAFSLLRQRHLADEAVMNVFLNLWRRREKLVITGVVRSYLFAAVGNQSLKLRTKERRHAADSLDETTLGKLTGGTRAEDNLLYQELRAEVDRVILSLPPRRQLIFRMNRIDGLGYTEIAKTLGVSKHTVQNHMILAVRQLATQLPHIAAYQRGDRAKRVNRKETVTVRTKAKR